MIGVEMSKKDLLRGKGKGREKRRVGRKEVSWSGSSLTTGATFWGRDLIFNSLSYLLQSALKQSCLLRMLVL